MMTMSGPGIRRKTCYDNIWFQFSDRPNDISKDVVAIPYLQGFVCRLRITKIICAGKKLVASICTPCSQQFLCSDNT